MTGWDRNETDHTFSSGRTFRIRRSVPLQVLVLRAVENDDPELAKGLEDWFQEGRTPIDGVDDDSEKAAKVQVALRMHREIIRAMFVEPRVWFDEEEIPPHTPPENGDRPRHILVDDMYDSELTEALELAMEGVADATRFRGDTAGGRRSPGRKSVAAKPKPRPRPAGGKR